MSQFSGAVIQWPWPSSLHVPAIYILLAVATAVLLVVGSLLAALSASKVSTTSSALTTYARFFYASFLKPHTGDGAVTGQQAALESFYKAQVGQNMYFYFFFGRFVTWSPTLSGPRPPDTVQKTGRCIRRNPQTTSPWPRGHAGTCRGATAV